MKNSPDARKYWDNLANSVEFTIPLKQEIVYRYFPLNARILDYGCGYGRTLNQLWKMGYRNLKGVDFSAAMIARGNEQYPQLDLQIGSASTLMSDHPLFDVILLFAVLTCIPQDADQQVLIRVLDQFLHPGGFLYVNDFLLGEDKRSRERYEIFQKKYGTYGVFELDGGGFVRHHDPEWVQQLFTPFEQREYGIESYTTMHAHPALGFYYLGKKRKLFK